MVTDLDRPETVSRPVAPRGTPGHSGRSRIALVVALCALGVGVIFVAHNARHGAVAARIANRAHHVAPSTAAPLFGWTHWLGLLQWFTVIAVVQLIVMFAIAWWRYPKHPILLMAIVCTTLVWQDPIMNWAPYAVYNPAALALAGELAAGIDLTDGRALRGHRLRDVLPGPRLDRHLGPAPDPAAPASHLVRLDPPARRARSADLRHRLRLRRHPGDDPGENPDVHLLTGDPLRIGVHRQALPVPPSLGVRRWSPR